MKTLKQATLELSTIGLFFTGVAYTPQIYSNVFDTQNVYQIVSPEPTGVTSFLGEGSPANNTDNGVVGGSPTISAPVVLILPTVTPPPTATPTPTPVIDVCSLGNWDQQISCWVVKYATKYTNNVYDRSVMIAKLHFLLSKEAKHGNVKTCGDNSKACGPLQFWAQTWVRMRTQMLNKGLITEIGDRTNMEQAIETTAWAISTGHEKEWGPILRKEIKL